MLAKVLLGLLGGIAAAALGLMIWFDLTGYADADAGTVVIISETEIGFTGSWLCNSERVRIAFYPSSVVISFERQTKSAKKMCGLFDCGSGAIDGAPPQASACERRYQLREPIDDRQIIVNGQPAEVVTWSRPKG